MARFDVRIERMLVAEPSAVIAERAHENGPQATRVADEDTERARPPPIGEPQRRLGGVIEPIEAKRVNDVEPRVVAGGRAKVAMLSTIALTTRRYGL